MTWREWLSSEYNTNGFYAGASNPRIDFNSKRYNLIFYATRVNQSITSFSELTTDTVYPTRDCSATLDQPIFALTYYGRQVGESPMISLFPDTSKQEAIQKAKQEGYVYYSNTLIPLN